MITDVEYQGTYVLLGLQNADLAWPLSPRRGIGDAARGPVCRPPYAVGEAVQLSLGLSPAAHPLSASKVSPPCLVFNKQTTVRIPSPTTQGVFPCQTIK